MAEKTTSVDNAQEKDELVLEDNQLVCALTNKVVKATDKELTLQSMIDMMAEEYGFAPEDMERDFRVTYKEPDSDKSRTQAVDLAIFDAGKAHVVENLIRFVVVAKDAKVKPTDAKKGVDAMLDNILTFTDCEFGCWTNGEDLHYRYYTEDDFGQAETQDISDFPANGQTLADLEAQGDRAMPRKPANESLIKTFKRCHDYIYGNEGMKKTAFWELLNLIFCKLYDEKRRNMDAKEGISYRRRFWVGVKEQFTEEGRKAVVDRIRGLFEELKESQVFRDVFDGSEQIMLSDRGLAFVAAELAKYSFLDATVDVKGTAYETIVSNTLKQEAGQFFTPRNIIKCMVEMLDPDQNTRVLDPDLKKAARMNMVMAGDGHSNIFNINSLDYPQGDKPDRPLIAEAVNESIKHSKDKDFQFGTSADNAQGKFDMIFTNPPFGAKVEVDVEIARRYALNSNAPEVLFIEACYNFLKPGGKMGIVLPDGILGNPNTESVRKWILEHFKLLASMDLPVETFLPQVGVQASLLFLQKKTAEELLIPLDKEDYDVFMAIVEQVGKDRRGVPIYKKDEDGAEILFAHEKKWLAYTDNGREIVRSRRERIKRLADDLPEVAAAYAKFVEEHQQ